MSHVIKYFLQIKYRRVPKKKNHAHSEYLGFNNFL